MTRSYWFMVALALVWIPVPSLGLENTFSQPGFGYTIDYPGDWVAERPTDYTVRFTGRRGTPAARVAFSIQNVASTAIGGRFDGPTALLDDLKCQLVISATDICIHPGPPFTVLDTSGTGLTGPQIIAEYRSGDDVYKKWIAVVPHSSGDVFYVAMYTALRSDYDRFKPAVDAMVATWTIGGTGATPDEGKPPTPGSPRIVVLLHQTGHIGPYDYVAEAYDKRYYQVVVTEPGYLALAVIDEEGESISGWLYTPAGVELLKKPGNFREIYTNAYEVPPGTYTLKVGQDTMVTESDFEVYVFFSTAPFTVEDLIVTFGPKYQVLP